jgi:hypothetical protein
MNEFFPELVSNKITVQVTGVLRKCQEDSVIRSYLQPCPPLPVRTGTCGPGSGKRGEAVFHVIFSTCGKLLWSGN